MRATKHNIVLPTFIVLAIAAIAVGAYAWHQRSPFVLLNLRAGTSFDAIDDAEVQTSKRRFTCTDLAGSGRYCQIHGQRLKGMIRVFVDADGRAAAIQLWPEEDDQIYLDEARLRSAQWSRRAKSVTERVPERPFDSLRTRWVTRNGRWSAGVRYGRFENAPSVIEVADQRSIDRTIARNPIALFQLAAARVIDPPTEDQIVAATRRAVDAGIAELPAGAGQGPTLELTSLRRPLCPARSPDRMLSPTETADARTELGARLAAVMEQAIPQAFAELRLVLGDRAYLVGPEGNAEAIDILATQSFSSGTVATVITFPRRAAFAEHLAANAPEAERCRAPAHLVVSDVGPDGRVTRTRRTLVDPAANVSMVTGIDFAAPVPNAPPALGLTYWSSYAAADWRGTIDWTAAIALDSLRVLESTPVAIHKIDRARQEKSGALTLTDAPSGVAVATVDRLAHSSAARFFIVPTPRASLTGWALLDVY
jgi:hypothetical protein